jgi:hypothetical protein
MSKSTQPGKIRRTYEFIKAHRHQYGKPRACRAGCMPLVPERGVRRWDYVRSRWLRLLRAPSSAIVSSSPPHLHGLGIGTFLAGVSECRAGPGVTKGAAGAADKRGRPSSPAAISRSRMV